MKSIISENLFSNRFKKHCIIFLFFVLVSVFWSLTSWNKGIEHLTSDLHVYLGIVLKEHDESLFVKDLLFGDKSNYLHIPIYTEFLKFFYEKTGDITFGLKILTFPLNFIFMVGAYYLFIFITKNDNISVLFAFLSSLPLNIPLSAEIFGIGPATIITPRVIFTAFSPLIILLFYRSMIENSQNIKIYISFLLVGLLANIYPISAYLLAQILILSMLLFKGANSRTFLLCIKSGMFSLLGAIPYFIFYFSNLKHNDFDAPLEKVVEIFKWRIPYFYPQEILLDKLPVYLLHVVTFVLIVIPPVLIYFYKRTKAETYLKFLFFMCFLSLLYMAYTSSTKYYFILIAVIFLFARIKQIEPKDELSLYFGFSIFYVGVLGVILYQAGYIFLNIPPFSIIHQFRATRFAGFLIFLLLTICFKWVASNYKNMSSSKKVVIITMSIFVLFMAIRDSYRTYVRVKPDRVREDVKGLSLWAKENTPGDTLFVFDSALFRLLSERSITVATKDIGMLFITKRNFVESYNRVMELKEHKKDLPGLIRIAQNYGANYLVLEKRDFPKLDTKKIIYQNSTYSVVSPEKESLRL